MAEVYYISGVKDKRKKYVYVDAYRRRYPHIGETITAQSQPDLDDWGPDSYWGCAQWMNWHIELAKVMPLQQANLVWLTAWEKQTFGAYAKDWCKFDNTFVNYLVNVGLLDTAEPGMILPNVLNTGGAVVNAGSQAAQNASSAVNFLTKLIKPALVVGLIGAAYYGYKQVSKP